MQIQFNTGVCTLLLVKVPEDAHNFEVKITNETKPNQLYYLINDNIYITNQRLEILPNGNWQFIGLSHELTEEQCNPLVLPITYGMHGLGKGFKNYDENRPDHHSEYVYDARSSFNTICRHLKVYNVNPHKHPIYMGTMDADSYNEMIHLYDHYQERTGTWAVLRLEE